MNESASASFRKVCFVRTEGAGDTAAFERALQVSERAGAEMVIVGAVETPPKGTRRFLEALGVDWRAADDQAARVEQLATAARGRGIAASVKLLEPPLALEAIRLVQREGCDLLIKSAQPSTAVRYLLFGHSDRQLVRKCPCPVWIHHPLRRMSQGRVLAAVDAGPPGDDERDDSVRRDLNRAILRTAREIARLQDSELHVVHVWHTFLDWRLPSRAALEEAAVERLEDLFRRAHEQSLSELVGPFLPDITRVHLLRGEAAAEIPRLAQSEEVDLLVMGTLCRSGIAGWLIGNTAETVLDLVDCSLVALKPRGFVSPVDAGVPDGRK